MLVANQRVCRDRRITQDEYDRKARKLKARQAEIAVRIERPQEGEGSFPDALAPTWTTRRDKESAHAESRN